jgi:ATP/maltotriose-dependent transcriptional regulator MalT
MNRFRELRQARACILRQSISQGLELLDQLDKGCPESAVVVSETRALRALVAAFRDDSSFTLSFARSKQEKLSPCAATACRYAYWRSRDLEAFYSLPRGTRAGWRGALLGTLDSSMEAALEFEQLRLTAARHVAMDALAVAASRFPASSALCAAPASIAAMVSYEQGFLGEAVDLVRGRLPSIQAAGTLDCVLRTYWVLGRAAAERGEFEAATMLWREADLLGQKRDWPRLSAMSIAERVRSFSQRGSFSVARREAALFDRLGHNDTPDVREYRALANAYLGLTEPPSLKTVEAFRSLYQQYTSRRNLHAAMSIAVYMVCAFERLGAVDEAERLLLSILRPARAAGAFQLVLDGGALVFQVLERVRNWPTDRELMPYISSLLNRHRVLPARPLPRSQSVPAPKLIHGLSPRERDILALVGRGLTNKRIANTLTITPETVKSHVKRIFSKLDVRTRAEAVSLGLRGGLFRHD